MNFVFDLDGTICFDGLTISEEISSALQELVEQGHQLHFASARPIRDILPVLPPALQSCNMVGANGALASKGREILSVQSFDDIERDLLISCLRTYQTTYMADSIWDYSFTDEESHPLFPLVDVDKTTENMPISRLDPLVKVLILSTTNIYELQEFLDVLDVSLTQHQGSNAIDVSPKGVNKWSGLKKFELPPKSFVAFGNDLNDRLFLQNAQQAVLIGSHPELLPHFTDSIPLVGDYKKAISEKIRSFL